MIRRSDLLPVERVADLAVEGPSEAWLIRPLWGCTAVGVVGGAPKCCKSWFGLDVALSVATGTPCLDRFPVERIGRPLIYLAEDALPTIRARIESICRHRGLDIETVDLDVITAPNLRLDREEDQRGLAATIEAVMPSMLLLDPLIRLHRLDENSASEMSGLLSYLRELQRRFGLAIVLVHHASKKRRAVPGQALRGSSDLYAWGDSFAHLGWHRNELLLRIEHRAARAPDPIALELVSGPDGSATHLEAREDGFRSAETPSTSLSEAVIQLLLHAEQPLTRTAIRSSLRVNNQRLGQALRVLEERGILFRGPKGWTLIKKDAAHASPTQLSLLG